MEFGKAHFTPNISSTNIGHNVSSLVVHIYQVRHSFFYIMFSLILNAINHRKRLYKLWCLRSSNFDPLHDHVPLNPSEKGK